MLVYNIIFLLMLNRLSILEEDLVELRILIQ